STLRAHRFDLPARRSTEETSILATELRCALVTHAMSGGRGIAAFEEHEPACLVQTDLLLVLQRRHRGHRFEVMMQRRDAHVQRFRERLDSQRLRETCLDQADRARDTLHLTARAAELLQAIPQLAGQ